MQLTWISLVPPLLVLSCAIVTRKVLISLAVGIIISTLIMSHYSLSNMALLTLQKLWAQLIDPSNLYTFAFLILLGILINLINRVGGAFAYGKLIQKILKNMRTTQFSSIGLSLLFMIDDFFSILTVGCIMRPLTDSFKIPRVKLAFLIDSLAAPLVIIMPISTWIAMILMQINKAGISLNIAEKPLITQDPFLAYLQAIPFVFYSCTMLVCTWFIVFKKISFGPMQKHEEIALATGNLFGGKSPLHGTCPDNNQKGTLIDFILPIGSLLFFTFMMLLYSGNSQLIGGNNSLLQTIQTANIFSSLFYGCAIACFISFMYMLLTKKINPQSIPSIAQEGFFTMYESMLILLLAWTFSGLLKDDLQTGQYLAHLLLAAVPAFLLPALLFLASLLTASATGSSWGTIAVMLPLAVPMLATFLDVAPLTPLSQVPLLLPVIGAVFSGAVAGDHVSPLGTTTVMAATSAGCYLEDHVITQFPYALPVLLATFCAYIISGYFIQTYSLAMTFFVSCALSISLALLMLGVMNKLLKKR